MPESIDQIVFYGTLMRGSRPFLGAQENIPLLGEKIRFVRECQIAGRLFDIGRYPGLVETAIARHPPQVDGELYEILDTQVIDWLDEYEGFYRDAPDISRYIRKSVVLIDDADIRAWCYFYNAPIDDCEYIDSGSWRAHAAKKQSIRCLDRGYPTHRTDCRRVKSSK